ncbi:hypothetical protein FRC17_008362 [Serendipita sp. 399]|nr:hypothetical protein FRC17_008362 [Serendipita sp. 399]
MLTFPPPAPSSHQPPPLPAKDREPSLSSPTPSAFKPPTSAAPKPKEKVEEGAPKGDAEDHGWKSLVPVAAVSEMIGRVRYRASILRASKDEKQEKAKEASTPDQ